MASSPDRPSGPPSSVKMEMTEDAQFREIDVAMLYIEEARSRTESGAAALRRAGADSHLVEAMERAQSELSEAARRLRQGTFFAVPSAQSTL